MEDRYRMQNKENVPPAVGCTSAQERRTPSHGQLSLGQRILASTTRQNCRPHLPVGSISRLNNPTTSNRVLLKDQSGLLVANGVVETTIKTGHDVSGLLLFPHQCAVRVLEVYPCGSRHLNDDGEFMEHCVGQIVRWSKNLVQTMDGPVQNEGPGNQVIRQFNFQRDDPLCDVRRTSNMEQHSESAQSDEDHVSSGAPERRTCVTPGTCSVGGVDGLLAGPPRREYKKTKRVTKDKGPRKIGYSRSEKVSLQNVQDALQSHKCSRGCMGKLKADEVLIKRYRAWGSDIYEERGTWILEQLSDSYNERTDKFETKLCGHSICNGCYGVALGYCKSRIDELKADIRSTGIISEVHGVQCRGRTSAVHGSTTTLP